MTTPGSLSADTHFGQYRIVRLLGRGGMGEVYEVEHRVLERKYALKLLPQDFASRSEAVRRFEREAKVMANLEHPHIVRVDEFGETNGRYWLRMELVHGVRWSADIPVRPGAPSTPGADKNVRAPAGDCITLTEYATRCGGRIEQGEFAGILAQLLDALACAHDRGVIHRDLKPGNILLENDPAGGIRVKVSDFGLARVIGEEFIRSQAQISVSRSIGDARTVGGEQSIGDAKTLAGGGTSTRALLGTWDYMSPEQRRGEEADARSDVYAVGLMCYRLLTGEELGMRTPSRIVGGLCAEWDAFLEKALEQKPGARYASAREMLDASAQVTRTIEAAREAAQQEALRQAEVEKKRKEDARLETEPKEREAAATEAARLEAEKKAHQPLALASPDHPWENSLGMKFVPVRGTEVLFCVWETRVRDFEAFANASGYDATNGMYSLKNGKWGQNGDTWKNPGFSQGPTHPVCGVSWEDAKAFCEWLSKKERAEGKISAGQSYRLPREVEWNQAVGSTKYPWGDEWPPPQGAGNYAGSEAKDENWPSNWATIEGYRDNYARTAPVGSFAANRYGLYDLGGNVWEWCEDWYDSSQKSRVLRGASWGSVDPQLLLSSFRDDRAPDLRNVNIGFRCVLVVGSSP